MTLLTNVWNATIKLLLPSLALAVLLLSGKVASYSLVVTSVLGAAVLLAVVAMVLTLALNRRTRSLVDRINNLTGGLLRRVAKHHTHEVMTQLRSETRVVLRRSWRRMTLGAVSYAMLQALLLYLCLDMLGSQLSPITVFAGYAMGSALTLVPLTPGGVGISETGSAALLVALGGSPAATAAGVLLYSTFTFLLEIPVGVTGAAIWWVRRPATVAELPPSPSGNAQEPWHQGSKARTQPRQLSH
jgi:uncharacterized protein (TIRG00374 family)